jgi:hypothetical protein
MAVLADPADAGPSPGVAKGSGLWERLTPVRSPMALPLALVLLPMVAGVVTLLVSWLRGSPYAPFGDQVFIEFHVRDLGSHAVLTGPFSRYGWDHPGPLMYYLLAPLYWLTGTSQQSLAITPLLTNAACVVGIALLVRRRSGTPATLWTLVVLAIYLRVFGAASLQNNWNPDFPVLPCALMAFLSWDLACGSRWALPAIVALASFQVQSHAGFAPAVLACLATAVGTLAIRAIHARVRPVPDVEPGRLRPWLRPLAVTLLVLVVLWLPPIIDAAAHSGGNLRELFDYFGSAKPDGTWRAGISWLNSDLGALPAYVTGVDRHAAPAVQPPLPGWTGIVALLALVASVVLAIRRRSRDTAVLVALTALMCLAGLVAVRRIVGPLFDYLAAWVLVAGILLWTTLGVALLGQEGKRPALALSTRARRPGWAIAVLGLVALAGVATAAQVRVTTPWTYTDTVTQQLDAQVVSWLGDHRHDLVRVGPAGHSNDLASFVAANNRASALVMALNRSGVPVRVSPYYVGAYGKPRGADQDKVRRVLTVVQGSGTGQRGDLVARAGDWLVYATPGPAG